jgi:oxalate decarboxylase/phosphoglucose isomerase-like protein (cupin superfamily)
LNWVKAIKVKAGDMYSIPPFAGHLMINTGSTWLVTSDDSPVYFDDSPGKPKHADYEPVKKMHGFAYYVVDNRWHSNVRQKSSLTKKFLRLN